MADKDFGVKRISLINSSGTPNITSPNNLNLNAVTVAISTDLSIGGEVSSNLLVSDGYYVGIGTTNPTSSLHVFGDTLVTGVITSTRFDGTINSSDITASALNLTGIGTFATIEVNQSNLNLLNVSGISTFATDVNFNGNVSIAGTLTYEDVTNIDSVGLITSRSGVRISDGGLLISSGISTFNDDIRVGSAITISSPEGSIVASIFYGDLIGDVSGSITDATNLTGGTADASSLNVSGITTISQGRIQADAGSNLRFGNLAAGAGSGRNIAIGDQVLYSLSGGQGRNIGIGELSYYDTTSGQYNVGLGINAGQKITTGSYNVIIGGYNGQTGLDLRTSSNNVVIADGQGNIRQYINSSGNVGIKTTVVTEALTVAGIVSATGLYGTLNASNLTGILPALDGSNLFGVTATGSGVEIRDSGSVVGTAATIDFGTNLTVSFASGIATVSGASSVSAATTAYVLAGTPNLNVGVVTATTLNVTGDRLVLPRGTSKGIHFGVPPYDDGANDSVIFVSDNVSNAGEFVLNSGDYNTKIIAPNLVVRNNNTDQCSIGGSISSFILSSVGIGTTTPNSELDVVGNTKVSGVVTASSFFGSGEGLFSIPATQLTGQLPAIDGSALLNVNATGSGIVVEDDAVNVGSARTVNFGTGLDVTYSSSGIATISASGGSLQSRTIVTGITTSIANNGIGNTNITGFKSYALMKVGLSTAGWLRLYTDSTSRANDVSRSVGVDPAPGSGVIAEVVTTGISTTQIITPFVMGGNLDEPADTTIYASITNLSGSTQVITATLTILQLEA
jgi:hypothetical protein